MPDYTHTLVNPGAETGDLTGWTNEINSFLTRLANPSPYEGTYYFVGGPFAECAVYQRVDLVTDGVPTATIDAGGIWFWVEWYQSSYGGFDQGEIQIRCLNSSLEEIETYSSGLTAIDDAQTWELRVFAPILPANTRYVDIIMHGVRYSGTDCNCNFDAITAKSTDVNNTQAYLSQNVIEVLNTGDSSSTNALLSQNVIEVLNTGDSSSTNALLSQNVLEVLRSSHSIKNNTFKDDTAEQSPANITKRWDTSSSNITVKDEDGVVDSKIVQTDGTISTSWAYFTLDDPYPVNNCEVLIKVKLSGKAYITGTSLPYFMLVLRGTDTYATCNGYTSAIYAKNDGSFTLILGRYSNGSWIQLGSSYILTDNAITIDWDKWFYMRMYLYDTSIKTKVWSKQDDEPENYQIELTDATVSNAGYVGWAWKSQTFARALQNQIDFIDIITDVESSPVIPYEGDAKVDIYKTSVDILAEDNQPNEVLLYKTSVDILSSVPSESSSKVTTTIVLF